MSLFIFYRKASKQTSFSLCSVHNPVIHILGSEKEYEGLNFHQQLPQSALAPLFGAISENYVTQCSAPFPAQISKYPPGHFN